MALREGSEVWVFSTDSYAWTEPLPGAVTQVGTMPAGREWACLQLPDERMMVVAGHRSLILRPPDQGSPTHVDVYPPTPVGALEETLAENPDHWWELYVSAAEANRAARTVGGS